MQLPLACSSTAAFRPQYNSARAGSRRQHVYQKSRCPLRLLLQLKQDILNTSRNSKLFQLNLLESWHKQLETKEQSVGAKLAHDYYRLQKPANYNIVFSKALEEFTHTAVLAYECGYNEGLVREEISSSDLGLVLPNRLEEDDIENCVLSLALVWITLSMLPASASKRWATSQAVSEPTQQRWSGFVRMIVKGYFEKRWAAYPIDRLQMEISLVTGRLERPSIVAEWSRLVYSALEQVAPQWPSK